MRSGIEFPRCHDYLFKIFQDIEVVDFDVVKFGRNFFFFSCRVVGISDIVRGSASCSDRRIENGLPDVEFGVVIIV
jgi:hypothetical protein